ncbi:hypothetical protein PRIC2_005758 [Phytophthora ramorum]
MLDRVLAPDLLTKEIKEHVRKYLQFCDVGVDPVLCDYVTELAESIQTSQSVEETRALVLLDEITDANIRADATLALLRSALPPYSPALKSYAHNSARSWKAKRLEEIQEHVRLMEIQDMLTAYDIKRFDIADTKSASRMVSHILNQVSRPTAFTDAMLLVDAYSDLHCDRAVVKFAENLLADSSEDLSDVDTRAAKAIDALSAVKKRMDPKSNAMLTVSIMEEIIEFGVMLLEMEAEGLDPSYHTDKAELQSEVAPLSFVLRMLEALVAAYLPELITAMEVAGATENDTLTALQALLSMQELPEDAAIVVNTQMGKLLSTVFQSQDIDNYLALGSMLSMEQKDAFDAFRRQMSRENVAKDFNRFQQLAFVGADAARAWKQIAFLHQCVDLEGNARWWHYLKLLEIKCDHKAFQSERRDLEYIRRLVPALITRSNFDFYTVLEFTRHYQIDDNFPSLVYAESLLLEESATADLEYQDKIAGVIEDIHEQHLVKMLLKSIPNISGQDYDRLLFIFRLLLEHTSYREREEVERRVEVLQNLKVFAAFQVNDYLKTGESKRYQAGNCSSNESETGNKADVEKMSFHQVIANPLEVLARVVTKENFSVLIGLAEPLQLEPDELQMMLLKNMITKNLKQNTLGKCCSPIQFSDVEGILGCLSDTECRVTAAEWLAENFPLGEEKLMALEFALHAALSGANGGEDPSNTSFTGHEALTRLETKILRVKLELLFRNASSESLSLAEVINDTKQTNQLIALVSDPKKLFKELYRRYALWFCTQHSDKLNTVAKSIAKLLQLPMVKLRLELVREWLVKDAVQMGKNTAKEEDKEDPFELLEDEKLQRSDEDFGKRILYMASPSMKHGDSFGEEVLIYLVEFVKDSLPRPGVTFRAKMRALRVILRLGQLYHGAVKQYAITKYGIENFGAFFKELLDYTKHCTHMITFEERRVPYELSFVMKTDKEALTRSFLRRFSSNQPWMLRCASQLLLDFEIEASDLWEDVLSNMLKLGMVRSLTKILGPLSRKSFVRSLDCGRQVWEEVLTLPMIQLKHKHSKYSMSIHDNNDANLSAEPTDGELLFAGVPVSNVRSALAQIVSLLQKCPFLDQIDVPAFVIHVRDLTEMAEGEPNGAEIVSQMDLYGFAVKCAMIIPKPVARFEALVRIIRAGAFGSVLQELLDTSCFLDGDQNEMATEDDSGEFADNFRLIQEIFSEAAKRKDYSSILATPFEPGFVEYLAATADIDYLLSLLLEDKRMETALNAVELFYEYHPAAAPSLDSTKTGDEDTMGNPDSKRWELIEAYLESSESAHLERSGDAETMEIGNLVLSDDSEMEGQEDTWAEGGIMADRVHTLNKLYDADIEVAVTVTGASRMGKSLFFAYFVESYSLEHPLVTIITASFGKSEGNWTKMTEVVVWQRGKAVARAVVHEWTMTKPIMETEERADNGVLSPVRWNMCRRGIEMVCVTSPSESWLNKITKKDTCPKLTMPLWDLEKRQTAAEELNLTITEPRTGANSIGQEGRHCHR